MKKFFITVFVLSSVLFACNCKFDKEKIKCDYYVYKNHDKSHQKNCIAYAKDSSNAKVYDKAALYYLLGGDTKNAKINAQKAIALKQYYALEYVGLADLIENKPKEAKKAFNLLNKKIKDNRYIVKDIQTIAKLYKNFDQVKALKMLK